MLDYGDCKVVAVTNQKGGVGKTTLSSNLAAALGLKGLRVLLADLDSNLGSTKAFRASDSENGSFEAIAGTAGIEVLRLRHDDESLRAGEEGVTLPKNVDLLCGCRTLEYLEADIRERNRWHDPTGVFAGKLRAVAHEYDFVLLDTGGAMSLACQVAYECATSLLLVVTASADSTRAAARVIEDMEMVRAGRNPNLALIGAVCMRVPGVETLVARQELQHLKEGLPEACGLFPIVPEATAVEAARSAYSTVVERSPEHKAAKAFVAIADELIERLAQRRAEAE